MARDMKATYTEKSENVENLRAPIGYPDMDKGRILDTQKNLKCLLDLHKISVKWNIMLRMREIHIPGIDHFVDEKENADLAHIYHLATTNNMPNTRIDKHLDSLAWINAYHPVRECLLNKPWDKKPRLDSFISCVKTKNDEFSYKIIRRWMLSAIAAAFSQKGFSNQGVLVLQGEQNIGKTRWVKSLSPIGGDAVKEGILLDPSNKDSVITASQCWIGELGELDGTFRKSDIARIKSYITSSVDVVRLPYNARNSYLSRRTVFVATVNEAQFLVDDTGNRRWWTIEVESINSDHGLDIQQVWAEVYEIWAAEVENTWLSSDEIQQLNETNVQHEQIDPFEEKILEMFDWYEGWENGPSLTFTTTQALEKIGYEKPTKSDVTRMGKILTKLTGKPPKRNKKNRNYTLPLLSSKFKSN